MIYAKTFPFRFSVLQLHFSSLVTPAYILRQRDVVFQIHGVTGYRQWNAGVFLSDCYRAHSPFEHSAEANLKTSIYLLDVIYFTTREADYVRCITSKVWPRNMLGITFFFDGNLACSWRRDSPRTVPDHKSLKYINCFVLGLHQFSIHMQILN